MIADKIIKIPFNRWETDIKPIMETVFDSDMPDSKMADFYGAYDERGKIKTFILVERVVIIGQVYSSKVAGDKSGGQSLKKLIDYIVKLMPQGQSVAAVASEKRFEGLFNLLKMRKIAGTFFRRNL